VRRSIGSLTPCAPRSGPQSELQNSAGAGSSNTNMNSWGWMGAGAGAGAGNAQLLEAEDAARFAGAPLAASIDIAAQLAALAIQHVV